ncbi:uncharacterized protein [Diabrotica undecimpunctata]|uniref:uncharacterized protein n=1 Tax=Diabrotica undecimpunctata TaxID=50387 RepID=UPI003B637991
MKLKWSKWPDSWATQKKTHEEFYRLPQDIFQMAKIAKLLLMMEKGVGAENKGKTLNEIDSQLEMWNNQDTRPEEPDDISNMYASEPNCSKEMDSDVLNREYHELESYWSKDILVYPNCNEENYVNANRDTKEGLNPEIIKNVCGNKKKGKMHYRGTWTAKQKSVMSAFFKSHLKSKVAPKKQECLKLKNERPDLFRDKTWVQIKVFVYNSL